MKSTLIAVLAVLGQCMPGIQVLGAPPIIPANGWQMPVDVANATNNPVAGDWLNLGWRSFLALNWPANTNGIGGEPNTNLAITAPAATRAPAVWQTYLAKEQVFLANGVNPGNWLQPTVARPSKEGLPVFGGFAKQSDATDDDLFDEATGNPLIDQNTNYVVFEIRLNQAEFTYLQNTGYYDAANQIAAFPTNTNQPPTFIGMPKTGQDLPPVNNPPVLPIWAQQGALEIKAAWRILIPGKDDFSRYWCQPAYFQTPDNQVLGPYTFGLIGFHILRLTPSTGSTWFWASFEQVDNVEGPNPSLAPPGGGNYPNGYSFQGQSTSPPAPVKFGTALPAYPPVSVSRVTPIPAAVAATNQLYQAALAGTPWQFYQQIQVQFPVHTPNPPATVPVSDAGTNTPDMRNVTMETYSYPANRNCTDCHGYGFPQMDPSVAPVYHTGDYQIFTFLLGGAQSSAKPGAP